MNYRNGHDLPPAIVFTDLDATLLDHHTYSWEAAKPALNWLAQQSIPIILTSSKTLAEMQQLAQELQLHYPLVVENGAAVAVPQKDSSWHMQSMGIPRTAVLDVLHALRQKHAWKFAGFADWTDDDVAQHTGLPLAKASLARQRYGTEPILWQDSEEAWQKCQHELAQHGVRAIAGGRFIHVMGTFDKADGMLWTKDHLFADQAVTTVALGDSPNDIAMLSAADIAVVIQSPGPRWSGRRHRRLFARKVKVRLAGTKRSKASKANCNKPMAVKINFNWSSPCTGPMSA